MADKVQKIREWVKARLDENASKQSLPQFYGMMEEDARFLDFLDSLQEEPIFKVGDTIQKKDDNSIRYSIINKTSDGYRALRGLSDTIVIWFSEQDQWELVEEPVSEDLEQFCAEYERKVNYDGDIYTNVKIRNAIKAGINWKKQQLIKNVVLETDVLRDSDGDGVDTPYESWLTLANTEIPELPESLGLEEGDKVKILIVKSE